MHGLERGRIGRRITQHRIGAKQARPALGIVGRCLQLRFHRRHHADNARLQAFLCQFGLVGRLELMHDIDTAAVVGRQLRQHFGEMAARIVIASLGNRFAAEIVVRAGVIGVDGEGANKDRMCLRADGATVGHGQGLAVFPPCREGRGRQLLRTAEGLDGIVELSGQHVDAAALQPEQGLRRVARLTLFQHGGHGFGGDVVRIDLGGRRPLRQAWAVGLVRQLRMAERHIAAEAQRNDAGHDGDRDGRLYLFRVGVLVVARAQQGAGGLGTLFAGEVGVEIAAGDAAVEIGDEAIIYPLFAHRLLAGAGGGSAVAQPQAGDGDGRGADQGTKNRKQDHGLHIDQRPRIAMRYGVAGRTVQNEISSEAASFGSAPIFAILRRPEPMRRVSAQAARHLSGIKPRAACKDRLRRCGAGRPGLFPRRTRFP